MTMIKYKILFAEDIQEDMELAEVELRRAGIEFESRRVDNRNDFIVQLQNFQPDVVISDYSMPGFNGMDALQIVLQLSPTTPVIIHTGSINEETAVKCMKAGASDYLLKDKIRRLPFALREAYARSITQKQKKHSEMALKISEEKYKGLFFSLAQGVFYVDAHSNISMVNPAAKSIFQLDQVENLSIATVQKDWIFKSEDGRNLDLRGLRVKGSALYQRKISNMVVSAYHTVSETSKWLLVNIIPQYIADENLPLQTLFIVEDITERKRAELDLLHAKLKAEESDRLKTAFLANLSHEVRTPMNAILGFSELLAELNKDDETEQYFISTIHNNSIKLLSIISDIIEMSKIETETISIFRNNFKLKGLKQALYNNYSLSAEAKGLDLQLIGFEDNLSLYSDEEKIKKVLSNLLDNAIKFTEKGIITVSCSLKPGKIEFHVIDTGPGIPPGNDKLIFERFRQVDEGYNRKHGGTGLGLSIAKAYVLALNGNIWYNSLKTGSDFAFSIPVEWTHIKKPERAHTPPVAVPDFSDFTILVAEDDQTNYVYLTRLLSPTGIKLMHAYNGAEAVEHCEEHKHIQLVLMDMKMPVMDGYEATAIIRKKNIQTPIIATTAYAISGDKEKCLAAGCDDYISKPIKKSDFYEMLSKYLVKEMKKSNN